MTLRFATLSWRPSDEIDLSEPRDVRHWCEAFGVSNEALREAVEEVGPRVAAVATELGCVITPEQAEQLAE